MTDAGAAIRDVNRISAMPYGLARTQAAEQVLRRLDTEGPAEVVPYALATLVDSMFWAGEAEKSFVPFTRLVRLWDEHPEHFDDHDRHGLFWMFKWMVADLMEFPAVPAGQIEATIEDMARRYALEGLGMNAVMQQRFLWAEELGDPAASDEAFDAWCATPRDDFSQCRSCEPGDRGAYLLTRGRYAEAVAAIEGALAESARCATEPADMLSVVQLAYLALGRDGDAARAYRRAVAELENATGEMAGARGRLIEFCARSGNDDAALRRIAADQALLASCETPRARLDFLLRTATATRLLRADGGGDRAVDVALPGHDGSVTVAELDDWAYAQAAELAAAFDARNGTAAASALVARTRTAERSGRVVDLAVLRVPDDAGDDAAGTAGGAIPRSSATTAAGAAAGSDEDALLEAAEQAARDGDLEEASARFLAASRVAEEGGRLTIAGWSLANAARCAWRSSDAVGANVAFARGLSLLDAAGVPPEALIPVLVDYGQCAADLADAQAVQAALRVIEQHAGALEAHLAAPAAPAADARAADDVVEGPEVDTNLAERTRALRQRSRAELMDLRARLLATAGELAPAAVLAEEAAEALAGLGAVADAAHAFWLAGRLHRDLGDLSAAAWHLESATEGFELARDAGRRADVASELIAVLRAAGRDDEADAVRA